MSTCAKLCNKLLVFEGEGKVKEWVGSYTELREKQKYEATQASKRPAPAPPAAAAPAPKSAAKKMTYGERLELQKIDKEMPKLEAKKAELLTSLSKGGTDHHKMMELSLELEKITAQLDRMTDRWLVLSEKE